MQSMHANTHKNAHTNTHTRTCMNECMHTSTHTHTHTHTHARKHTYTHTHTHAHTHTYTHTHVHRDGGGELGQRDIRDVIHGRWGALRVHLHTLCHDFFRRLLQARSLQGFFPLVLCLCDCLCETLGLVERHRHIAFVSETHCLCETLG